MNVIDLISSVEDILIEGQLPILKTKSLVDVDELLDMLDAVFKVTADAGFNINMALTASYLTSKLI